MAVPRARLDSWGQPLPELAEARQAVLKDTPHNQAMRRLLHVLIEEQMGLLLRRGVHAEVTVGWVIQDGVMQEEIAVTPKRCWRKPREE
jgi:hypothetical protein